MTRKILPLLFAALLLSSCDLFNRDGKEETYTILIYMAGDNSISMYAEQNIYGNHNEAGEGIYGLIDGYIPRPDDATRNLLVYFDNGNVAGPTLSRYYRGADGQVIEQTVVRYPAEQNSADAGVLKTVIADAEMAFPSDRHGLILWSHGSGFMPEGYYYSPKDIVSTPVSKPLLESFAEEDNKEIEIPELKEALDGIHYEFIILDCCLMGGVEVAYELRNSADYILASPTEIMAEGMPYGKMMEYLFTVDSRETALKMVCLEYMNNYFAKTGSSKSASIAMIKCDELEDLALSCRPIFENHRDRIKYLNKNGIQCYDRNTQGKWMYDLDHFISKISDEEEYSNFRKALDKAVIFKSTTGQMINLKIDHYSGLSIYIPDDNYVFLNDYYRTLKWNEATGLVK